MPAKKAVECMKAKETLARAELGRSPFGHNKEGRRLPTNSSRSMPREVCNRDLPNHRVVRPQSLSGLHWSASSHVGRNLVHGPHSTGRLAGHFGRAGNHSHELGG